MGFAPVLSGLRRALAWQLTPQAAHRGMATVAARLTSRAVIEVSGEDSQTFLQGITTNDMLALEESDAIYTAFLSSQGRIQHDAFVYRCPRNGTQAFLLDVSDRGKEELVQQMLKYKLRAKVNVKDVSDSMQVWAVFDNDTSHEDHANPDFLIDVESDPLSTVHEDLKFDARLTGLGLRGILPAEQPKIMGFCGAGDSLVQLAPSIESLDLVNNRDYVLHRCMWGVAESAEEMGNGKGVVAEHNLDHLNGVSYHKGCYIGQELTARTHYQGVVRKRVCIVRAAGGRYAALAAGDSLAAKDGRGGAKGEIRAWEPDEGIGLAMVRVDSIHEDLVAEDGTLIKVEQPKWLEEAQHEAEAEK